MKELSLGSNQIGDSGARALANALPQCGLEWLFLTSNRIGNSGARALANALPQCGLEYLDLQSNPLGASVKSELHKMDEDGSNPVLNREVAQ